MTIIFHIRNPDNSDRWQRIESPDYGDKDRENVIREHLNLLYEFGYSVISTKVILDA